MLPPLTLTLIALLFRQVCWYQRKCNRQLALPRRSGSSKMGREVAELDSSLFALHYIVE